MLGARALLKTKSLALSCYNFQDKTAPDDNQHQICFPIVLSTSSFAALCCSGSSPAFGLLSVMGEKREKLSIFLFFFVLSAMPLDVIQPIKISLL